MVLSLNFGLGVLADTSNIFVSSKIAQSYSVDTMLFVSFMTTILSLSTSFVVYNLDKKAYKNEITLLSEYEKSVSLPSSEILGQPEPHSSSENNARIINGTNTLNQ